MSVVFAFTPPRPSGENAVSAHLTEDRTKEPKPLPLPKRLDLRPLLRGMQDAKTSNRIFTDGLGNDVRQSWNDKFASARYTSRPPALWKIYEMLYRLFDGVIGLYRRSNAVVGDVVENPNPIVKGRR
jgi:hypothetical protein